MDKLCSKCKKYKDIEKDFGKKASNRDGRQYWCSSCRNQFDHAPQRARLRLLKSQEDETTPPEISKIQIEIPANYQIMLNSIMNKLHVTTNEEAVLYLIRVADSQIKEK